MSACGDDRVRRNAVTTAPSVPVCNNEKAECNEESMKYVGLSYVMRVNDIENRKCIITNGVCCDGCNIKTIQISVKKRVQNKKTLLWSDRSRKVTKPICVRGDSGRANLAAGTERGE